MKLVFLGLSFSSSWGNGHATTYRALLKGLHQLGHEVTFLERDVPWYAGASRSRQSELLPSRILPLDDRARAAPLARASRLPMRW